LERPIEPSSRVTATRRCFAESACSRRVIG
jgi:hypothetical protein